MFLLDIVLISYLLD